MAKKRYGSKSGSLKSESIYEFDLDNQTLRIQDWDLFIPKQKTTFAQGFRLKTVSQSIKKINRSTLYEVNGRYSSISGALENSTPIPKRRVEVTKANNCFEVIIHKPIEFSPSFPVLLALDYTLDLQVEGPHLLYCGSVQPSDYIHLHDHLNEGNITKKIKLFLFSRCTSFESGVYDASNPIAFPRIKSSHYNRVQSISHELNMSIDLDEWERAKTFSVFSV